MDILKFNLLDIPALAPTDNLVITIDEASEIYNPADSAGGSETAVLLCYLSRYTDFPYELG